MAVNQQEWKFAQSHRKENLCWIIHTVISNLLRELHDGWPWHLTCAQFYYTHWFVWLPFLQAWQVLRLSRTPWKESQPVNRLLQSNKIQSSILCFERAMQRFTDWELCTRRCIYARNIIAVLTVLCHIFPALSSFKTAATGHACQTCINVWWGNSSVPMANVMSVWFDGEKMNEAKWQWTETFTAQNTNSGFGCGSLN